MERWLDDEDGEVGDDGDRKDLSRGARVAAGMVEVT